MGYICTYIYICKCASSDAWYHWWKLSTDIFTTESNSIYTLQWQYLRHSEVLNKSFLLKAIGLWGCDSWRCPFLKCFCTFARRQTISVEKWNTKYKRTMYKQNGTVQVGRVAGQTILMFQDETGWSCWNSFVISPMVKMMKLLNNAAKAFQCSKMSIYSTQFPSASQSQKFLKKFVHSCENKTDMLLE